VRLIECLKQPKPAFTAWSGSAGPEAASLLAGHGFDAVTVDLQHGMHDESSAYRAALDIARRGSPAILRIPVGRNDLASRALDAGYQAVIAPMINDVVQARAFAAAMKYPPLGERSYGPKQALALNPGVSPKDFYEAANKNTLAIAMIETVEAVELLEEILAVDGIDGVFVGPSDLSISMSGGKAPNTELPEMQAVLANVAEKANAAGKIAAIYATSAKTANHYVSLGYKLIAVGNEEQIVAAGAAEILAVARGSTT